MVNTTGGPVALFYQSLQLSEQSQRQGGTKLHAPRPPPKSAKHAKGGGGGARTRAFVVAGNEPHNLPALFNDVVPSPGSGIPCVAAERTRVPRRKAHAGGSSRKSIGTLLCAAGTAESSAPSRTSTGSPPPPLPLDVLAPLAGRAELLHILKFLPTDMLAVAALVSWQFCEVTRAVVLDRVHFRLATIAALEETVKREDHTTLTMAEAEVMMQSVRRSHIDEIRRMTRLPTPLHRMGEAVAQCFNTKKQPTWKDFVLLAQDPTALAQRMTGFDKSKITTRLMARLRVYIEDDDTVSEERIRAACEPAQYVCRWLHGVYAMGLFLFRPWATDRARATQQCEEYLRSDKPCPPRAVPIAADELERAVRGAGPLTTYDAFGSTMDSCKAVAMPPNP